MQIAQRPKLTIEKTALDKYLETVALLFQLCLIAIPFYYYSKLPDTIPIHLNALGEIDGYGSKYIIWVISIMGIGLHLLMSWLRKRPHVFNYPVKITEENAYKQYSIANRMLRVIDVAVLILFTYIIYTFCTLGLNNTGKTSVFIPITIVLFILFYTGYYLRKSWKNN